jgi:hypothetical protein
MTSRADRGSISPHQTEQALTVFVLSWGRPIYLWACLDALYRRTRSPARFVLLDNAHPDPLMGEVIAGFERRGLFAEVVRFTSNSLTNIADAYRERLEGVGPLHAYIESDCVVEPSVGCWLAEMRGIMERNPHLGVLGSLIDPGDFVSQDTALRLAGGDSNRATFLAKLASLERAFIQDDRWADPAAEYFLTAPPCPVGNPPGRLMMLRTDIMQQLGFQVDGPLARRVRELGLQPAVTPRVRHRHLSLLNIYDYADYDESSRNEFFAPRPPVSDDSRSDPPGPDG